MAANFSRRAPFFLCCGGLIAAGWFAYHRYAPNQPDSYNYRISWVGPAGWTERSKSPHTLFVYQRDKTGSLIIGYQQQVIDERNPSPELDTDGLAKSMIETTRLRQPEWKAAIEGDVKTKDGGRFRLVARSRKGKQVISAVRVQGNTTLVVALSRNDNSAKRIEDETSGFRSFLSDCRFIRQVM